MIAETTPTLGHVIAAHLITRFLGLPRNAGITFDELATEISDLLTEELRGVMRRFGTTVNRSLAWTIAPLVETGEARWESSSRRLWISPVGLQLLAAEANYNISSPVASPLGQQVPESRTERQPLIRRLLPHFLRG